MLKDGSATVPDVLKYYRKILGNIPQDENYILITEEAIKAIPNYKVNEKKQT